MQDEFVSDKVKDQMLEVMDFFGRMQDPELYGDGWTPLMAAAVAGRQHIAMVLLQRAGSAATDLVQAANRYGLTAAHIAARSGNVPLLRSLLEAGGGSIAKACFSRRCHSCITAVHLPTCCNSDQLAWYWWCSSDIGSGGRCAVWGV